MALTQLLKCKIHGARCTEANLDYQGSIAIDADLIAAAGLHEFEKVLVANVTNGARLETYVITAPAGSGTIALNGAAAHRVSPGDRVIIFAWALLTESEIARHRPAILIMDPETNRIARRVSAEVNAPV